MKLITTIGAAAVMSFMVAGAANANYVTKSLTCLPIEGTQANPYQIDCQVSAVFGTVKSNCVCLEGFSLYNPYTPIKLGEGEGTGTGPRSPVPINGTDS
jgi:hypothetical protein